MLVAHQNEPVPLRLLAADGRASLFARLNVYDTAGSLVATLAAAHLDEGLYTATWTPASEGMFTVVGRFFLDAMFTIDAEYERVAETVEVSTIKSKLSKILGLVHDNVVIDQHGYDGNGNLTTARLRTYDSSANAAAAGVTGHLKTYRMLASYTGTQQNSFTMAEEV
jgi:ribosomal protein S24E